MVNTAFALPPAGIDKISIRVHPELIARYEAFHPLGNINSCINLRKPVCNSHYYIEFHAEYFNPSENIYFQIVQYIKHLMSVGILKSNTTPLSTDSMLEQYFANLFSIAVIEFYFDFYDSDVYFNNNNPFYARYKGETVYSSDYRKGTKSSLCAYCRDKSLAADGNKNRATIDGMAFKKRIEFRFNHRNCSYLHPDNLQGDYYMIFCKYRYVMAKKWEQYGSEIAYIPCCPNYATYFQQIIDIVEQERIVPSHNLLLKTPRNPIPNHAPRKNDVDVNFFPRFLTI